MRRLCRLLISVTFGYLISCYKLNHQDRKDREAIIDICIWPLRCQPERSVLPAKDFADFAVSWFMLFRALFEQSSAISEKGPEAESVRNEMAPLCPKGCTTDASIEPLRQLPPIVLRELRFCFSEAPL
jgi:hypothetical protein